jgi:hypothetical protein
MRSRQLIAGLVTLGVFAVWIYSVQLRLAYMNQIPVYDADGVTAEGHMWARMWWDEGPLNLWFATPRAPRSIETPTLADRKLYESWPPGAFIPIYLVAKLLGLEPSVPMVNWINATLHGLIALTAALIAFHLALLNRLSDLVGGVLALCVSFPILLSSGLIYIFSQIYDVVTAVLIWTAIFILLEVLFYRSRSLRHRQLIASIQLATIFCAFFVDWLSYTLFAFWMMSRLVAGYLGFEERLTFRRLAGLVMVPVCAFLTYLAWRIFAPGSLASTGGVSASIELLRLKILMRMNLTDAGHITGFGKAFIEMHADYLSHYAFPLVSGGTLITVVLLVMALHHAGDARDRRSIFATLSVLMLTTVPFYVHMLVLYEHSFIHRWAITKAMLAYALVPFAFLPIGVFVFVRVLVGHSVGKAAFLTRSRILSATNLVLAVSALLGSLSVASRPFYFLGRINRDNFLMWDDIGRNTLYQDVVVSPILEANPLRKELGASYKLVHHADNFADVDEVVDHVCGEFNVVLALSKGSEPGAFASREPTQVIDTGRIRLLRFSSYRGKAIGCP